MAFDKIRMRFHGSAPSGVDDGAATTLVIFRLVCALAGVALSTLCAIGALTSNAVLFAGIALTLFATIPLHRMRRNQTR